MSERSVTTPQQWSQIYKSPKAVSVMKKNYGGIPMHSLSLQNHARLYVKRTKKSFSGM